MKYFPAFLIFAGIVFAVDGPDQALLLARARSAMAGNLNRLPDYTCLQTIERREQRTPRSKPRLLDTVRLEVALVDGRELFAWPGSRNFSDAELRDFAPGGAIGNGAFGLFAKAVFQSSVPQFTWAGESLHRGRPAYKWDFVVPVSRSGYNIRVNEAESLVGYHGSIVVEAATLDLISLDVHADDIPSRLELAAAGTAVEYQRMPIGNQSFLLPVESSLEMKGLDGSASLNRTRFTQCRQYSGESVITFDDESAERSSSAVARTIRAPAGLGVELALETPIEFKQAARGDQLTGVLTKELRLPDGIVIPKKAAVRGRLMTLREQYYGRIPSFAIGLKFFEIESGNTRVQFSATLEDIQTAQPGIRTAPRSAAGLQHPENDAVLGSVFFVQASTGKLVRGLRMIWRTKDLQSEDIQ